MPARREEEWLALDSIYIKTKQYIHSCSQHSDDILETATVRPRVPIKWSLTSF